MTAAFSGRDLGLLIGKHGQTIDAIQYLANAIVYRGQAEDRKAIVVDAAGYRERRKATLDALAVRSAERAVSTGQRVELEPMTAVERKVVHLRLKDYPGVMTASEGTEPNRFVVIAPGDRIERLRRWLAALLSDTRSDSIRDPREARRVHVDESLMAVDAVQRFEGPIVDVGSGGGAPGIPLAAALPEREVTLLEANGRKCAFLREAAREFPNVTCRPGARGGARDGQLRCRGREGAGATACGRRVVPAAGRAGRRCGSVRRSKRRRGGGQPSLRASRGRPSRRDSRSARASQAGADACRLPPPPGCSEEAAACVSRGTDPAGVCPCNGCELGGGR